MEKKIVITLIALALIGMSCNSKPVNDNKTVLEVAKHDTIYFGSEKSFEKYRDSFVINGAIKVDNGLAIETKGKGVNVWIDSLLYFFKHETKIVAIASTLDYGYCLLYYNGDSLSSEVIAVNQPTVEEFKTNKFNLIYIADSSFNSGYLIKSFLFFRIGKDGILNDKKEYFPQKKEKEKYDFVIRTECYKDSVIIFKNGKPEYTYK